MAKTAWKLEFERISDVAEKSYGGELPKQEEVEDINMTPEQLQVFLRLLSEEDEYLRNANNKVDMKQNFVK